VLDKVIKKGTKNVTCTVGIEFIVLLKESQKSFEHGSNAIPRALSVARSTGLPYNGRSTNRSLELEEGLHSELVFEVRGCTVSIEVPHFELNVTSLEVLSEGYTRRT